MIFSHTAKNFLMISWCFCSALTMSYCKRNAGTVLSPGSGGDDHKDRGATPSGKPSPAPSNGSRPPNAVIEAPDLPSTVTGAYLTCSELPTTKTTRTVERVDVYVGCTALDNRGFKLSNYNIAQNTRTRLEYRIDPPPPSGVQTRLKTNIPPHLPVDFILQFQTRDGAALQGYRGRVVSRVSYFDRAARNDIIPLPDVGFGFSPMQANIESPNQGYFNPRTVEAIPQNVYDETTEITDYQAYQVEDLTSTMPPAPTPGESTPTPVASPERTQGEIFYQLKPSLFKQ